MIFYFTYNEAPSGIFSSQVIDVVKFLNQELHADVKLLAFISPRNFFHSRKTIKAQLPGALVFPMYPKMANWQKNSFLLSVLCAVYKPRVIMARSVMATQLALIMRRKKNCSKVVYDGRGAIAAEWQEYKVVTNKFLLDHIIEYEKESVLQADLRISVSQALIESWKKNYVYSKRDHVVIPCTLDAGFLKVELSGSAILAKREALGLSKDDKVYIYSGSVAGWQSFDLLRGFIEPVLKKSKANKMVFFSLPDPNFIQLQNAYPAQVIIKHLRPAEVPQHLIVGDYGLLIREVSETNRVASPVKYAEYLACGLKVIISEQLGDYTALTQQKNWGSVFLEYAETEIKPGLPEKIKISDEAKILFSKATYKNAYQQLIKTDPLI